MRSIIIFSASACLLLMACEGTGLASKSAIQESEQNSPSLTQSHSSAVVSPVSIKLNQVGFMPSANKIAIVPGKGGQVFIVVNTQDNNEVMRGTLSDSALWGPSLEQVSRADFSQITALGNYRIEVLTTNLSADFRITTDGLAEMHDAAMKSYYFNRASSALDVKFAGSWSRPLGHPDDQVLIHKSAATHARPEGTVLSAPKGWYDAGDYNKYIVNSGVATYTLMLAFEHFPSFYLNRDLAIPESGDAIPDILNEIKWNLDWMQGMQDPNDGGVYHKLTTLNFSGELMPHEANASRYLVQKSTAAALNFSAVMAVASRIFKPYFPDQAGQYERQAKAAWLWASNNPNLPYIQPDDVSTGEYGDNTFSDEFAWAAAELFILTGQKSYLQQFDNLAVQPNVPTWADSSALGYISLVQNNNQQLSSQQVNKYKQPLLELANTIVELHQQSAYLVAMQNEDFVWGSNAVALNKALVLLQASRNTQKTEYKNAAFGLLDYVLGRNPTGYSYVTGFGEKYPMNIHHRQSHADQVVEPIPGFVAGGAHKGQQDGCDYSSDLAALSYLDHWCSYSTNEIAINWNAPLVYVLAGLQQM
jgi:endoglucanase